LINFSDKQALIIFMFIKLRKNYIFKRLIMLIKRDKFDYTKWQTQLWQDETVEFLSAKAQQAWDKEKLHYEN
jgi:hypothetical protein